MAIRCAVLVLLLCHATSLFGADARLHGRVVEAGTNTPIPGVRVVLDSLYVRLSGEDGAFDFGEIAPGPHTLVFEHISYARHSIDLPWPRGDAPLVVVLEPAQFEMEPIAVTAERPLPSLPVSAVSIDRETAKLTPGNIANDPLRTVQSHPSAATAGVDFLSTMAVRGGNTEEHRVYFDDIPLRHYSHVGGFSSVVYDEMLASTVLVPGAAPIRYKGTLSGVIMFEPELVDTANASLRYDITSIAGGASYVVSPRLTLQGSAKSDFFNLPVYQQVGVESRSFKDLFARAIVRPKPSLTLTPTLIAARDSETGSQTGGVGRDRETSSLLAALDVRHEPSEWSMTLRPYYSYFRSRDALTWSGSAKEHRLYEARVFGEIARQGKTIGLGVSGEAGVIEHRGYGGEITDTPFSLSTEMRLLYADAAAVVLGVGGTREEFTSTIEPEGYASLRLGLGGWLTMSGGFRRSHQTPFLFSERRFFASIPIDPGDLWLGFADGATRNAARMDQVSAEVRLDVTSRTSIEANAFRRQYNNLLVWEWTSFPTPTEVANGGDGRGHGYEIIFTHNDPDRVSLFIAASQARVWRTDGTLNEERVGDFDKPEAYQVGGSLRLSKTARLSARWTDVAGRPFTPYNRQTTPPPDEQVNSARLQRFRRLDVKLTFDIIDSDYNATFFIDIVNLLNRRNIAATYALELSPGEFSTVPYGGTRFFPIGGMTVRW